MSEIADVAQRLRVVREGCRRFLQLHAMEVAVIGPALDRMARDLEHGGTAGASTADLIDADQECEPFTVDDLHIEDDEDDEC